MKCCGNLTDVVCLSEKNMVTRQSSHGSAERKLRYELTNEDENPLIPQFRHYHIRNKFQELSLGNPSRNIIEMIFQASSSNPKKKSRKVRRVLKVNNSLEAVQKFEAYREYVKKASSYTSNEQHMRHPRSVVDGNELRQFYGTTMNCCGRNALRVSQLCQDPTCRVCRVIQSGFDTSCNRIHGIRLSTTSDATSEDSDMLAQGKNVEKAVIICRTIAGKITGKKYEPLGNGFLPNNQSLVLCNPTAVLPCFVVVFD